MRIKTSITLSRETVRAIDQVAGKGSNRSRVIEEAVIDYLSRRVRAERDARDRAILNRVADELNREMRDVLDDQADV